MLRPEDPNLNELVRRASEGDRASLDAIVRAVQDDVYGLALRMLWHPDDAADATQEILIKIVTHLGSFRGESAFRTWCFRIASNHLLTARATRAERRARTFEDISEGLARDAAEPRADARSDPEAQLFEHEVRLGCTLGILLCLDRPHRLAFLLGEVLGLSSDEGAEVSGVPGATYRKRLSRARDRMREFLGEHCGVVEPSAACRCERQVGTLQSRGLLRADRLLFARHAEREEGARSLFEKARELEDLHATVQLYRAHPDYAAPESLARGLLELLARRGPSVLSD